MATNKPAPEADASIVIDQIASETIAVPIVGTSPLIMHKFSEKAKRMMLDNMQGRKSPKRNKDPEADYESSFYTIKGDGSPDDYGFPCIGFKSATVSAARFYDKSVSMASLRQFLFFSGEPSADGQQMVRIEGEPVMREDVVRVGQGTDLRYRAMFSEWRTLLTVTFVTSALTRNSVLSLIDAGGLGVGVGEWRPERRGDFGTFKIDETRKVEVLSSK